MDMGAVLVLSGLIHGFGSIGTCSWIWAFRTHLAKKWSLVHGFGCSFTMERMHETSLIKDLCKMHVPFTDNQSVRLDLSLSIPKFMFVLI